MAYDKQSFLSGVAVGRNMESWPAFEGSTRDFAFWIYNRNLTLNYSFSLYYEAGHNVPVIDWGDGTVTLANNGRNEHDYSEYGMYRISVSGTITSVKFWLTEYYRSSTASLRFIESPIVADPNASDKRIDLNSMFKRCVNLQQVPGALLHSFYDNGYVVTDLVSMFESCNALQTIPKKLFYGASFSEGISISNMFSGCIGLEEIPSEFFGEEFADVSNASDLFNSCYSLKEVPSRLFANLHNCDTYSGCFAECSVLERVGDDLFGDCEPFYFENMFTDDYRLATLGQHLFNKLPGGLFRRTFYNCSSLSIPSDLMRLDWDVNTDFYECFCSNTGEDAVPELWKYYNSIYPSGNSNRCFYRCLYASNYADIPSDWK